MQLNCKNSSQKALNVAIWRCKIKFFFWGGGTAPSPDLSPSGEGEEKNPLPTSLAPAAPRFSRLRRSTSAPSPHCLLIPPQTLWVWEKAYRQNFRNSRKFPPGIQYIKIAGNYRKFPRGNSRWPCCELFKTLSITLRKLRRNPTVVIQTPTR